MSDGDYEYSVPVTVGGPTGVYDFRCPFAQYGEVGIITVVFTDLGYIFVSPDGTPQTLANTSNLGNTPYAGARGVAFTGTANQTVVPDTVFWAVELDQMIHVSVSVTGSHAGLVSFIFRRSKVNGTRSVTPFEVPAEAEAAYMPIYEKAVLEQARRGRS